MTEIDLNWCLSGCGRSIKSNASLYCSSKCYFQTITLAKRPPTNTTTKTSTTTSSSNKENYSTTNNCTSTTYIKSSEPVVMANARSSSSSNVEPLVFYMISRSIESDTSIDTLTKYYNL